MSAVLLSASMLWSCAASQPKPPPKPSDTDGRAEYRLDGGPVTESINKEVVPPGKEPPPSRVKMLEPGEQIWIRSGKSRVLELSKPVRRVSIGDPSLAGIVVLGPRTIMINAKEAPPGSTPEGAGGASSVGQITGRPITAEPRIGETTLVVWDGSEAPDVHTLIVADFTNQQVLLEVTVAELRRTAMEEYGIDFRVMANDFVSSYFMGGGVGPSPLLSSSLAPPQGNLPLLPLGTSATAPTYAFNLPNNQDITAFIQILQTEQLATVLAQPKILALSGQNAVFQVGGEIPIRIATGFSTAVEFKPFGTIVTFVPQVSDEGDILLTVTPEVSEPDFANEVEGIPTFIVRRASTSARLRNGETLVIGGLLQNERAEQVRGIPYLMNIPVVGYVFRNTQYRNQRTELLVVATPRLVHPFGGGVEDIPLPTDRPPLQWEDVRTKPDPAEVTRPRIPGLP